MAKSPPRKRITHGYSQQSARKHIETAVDALREGKNKRVRVDTACDHLEMALRALDSALLVVTTHAETVELRAWAEAGFNDSGLVYDARVLALCDSWVALSARLAALEDAASALLNHTDPYPDLDDGWLAVRRGDWNRLFTLLHVAAASRPAGEQET